MKRNLILGLLIVAGFPFLNSCKDDEPPIVGITFEAEEQTIFESDGTLESLHPDIEITGLDPGTGRIVKVRLVFEQALAGDVILKFDLDGTARENPQGDDLNDFQILEEGENLTVDDDEITILAGTAEAAFDIVIFEDWDFEIETDDFTEDGRPYETIELSLESVVSGPAKLGVEPLEHTLKILEDDVVGFLGWEARDFPDNQAAAAVDMDLILFFEDYNWFLGTSQGTGFELFFIPAGSGVGEVGIAYTYYGGNSDDLYFESAFFTTGGELEGAQYPWLDEDEGGLVFSGEYTLANINEYNQQSPPKVAQTATKEDIHYDNFSTFSAQ